MKGIKVGPRIAGLKYLTLLIIILSSLVITLLRPNNNTFQYQYYIGKPWQYEKLKANYEFPIYKSDNVIKAERDSIKEHSPIVFYMNDSIKDNMINRLNRVCQNKDYNIPNNLYVYIKNQLQTLYDKGLISEYDKSTIREKGLLELNLKTTNLSFEKQPITRFYNLKEAYEVLNDKIKKKFPDINVNHLDLPKYIKANIKVDTLITNHILRDAERNLPISNGIVQKNEVIVDNGQIIDTEIYNILNSLKITEKNKQTSDRQLLFFDIGLILSCVILLTLMSFYLNQFCSNIFNVTRNQLFIFICIILAIIITEMNMSYSWFPEYIMPYVMLIIMMRIFFDSRTAWVVYIFTIALSAIFVSDPLDFVIIELIAGMVALLGLQNLTSRAKLIKTTFIVFIVYIISSTSLQLYHIGRLPSDYINIIFIFSINLIFLMFTYLLVYVVEKLFGYVSNITLVELGDMSSPLLKELSEVAPGTFQHSIQVSILATEAAQRVGGDVLLIRTGALYHDIGKMKNPLYFTENQGVINPHNGLTYKESAKIIIKHVTDGVILAHKYNIPPQIIDFIKTHHGRSTTKYFYNSYCNEHMGEYIDPEPFTYPGPNPFSKETGILMLADAVEASSRSLKEHTEEGIKQLIDKIVDSIVHDGLLNDTPLTFRDIKLIKEVFYEKIKIMYHSRITYPDKKGNN